MDEGDASCSFLMNPERRAWSTEMIDRLGLDATKLPPIRKPLDILGTVTDVASRETGLAAGTPVLVGGADYPMALLGSGCCRPGLVSDVMGTSSILTFIAPKPLLDPEISNVATIEGNWGPFALLESGGDAMRWARRALHEGKESYEQLVARAAEAPAGANGLFFLPFLTGERLGAHRNARAQFFGLGAGHGLSHINRAILEGVGFAGARHLQVMEKASGQSIERVIASGGGAKTELWLRIKASIYGVPIVVPQEQECGLLGCAAMGAVAMGQFSTLADAVDAFVRYDKEIAPEPAWQEKYQRMQPIFDRLYFAGQAFYDDLDALAGPYSGE
jgi:xylulokinase